MSVFSTAIIGGGASGIMAAISSKSAGKTCVILEKLPRLGRKLLASGNGRCNILNEDLDPSFYNSSARPLVKSIFTEFDKSRAIDLFGSMGLYLEKDGSGRYFPITNQSATVLKILEMELARLSVVIEPDFNVTDMVASKDGFVITAKSGTKISADSVVLAGGGKSYPSFGSDGSAYKLAERFGHKIIDPVPVCVGLVVKDPALHFLQGQKIVVKGRSLIEGVASGYIEGDLLFTKYGLSGTIILDLSEDISLALNRKKRKDVFVSIDAAPYMDHGELAEAIELRIRQKAQSEDLLVGVLPNKFGAALRTLLKTRDAKAIAARIKDWNFKITLTRGWNEAEFTAGGISITEVREGTLESKLKKGLYFAGEVLDVNGKRGGYNLAWAWASGYVAGKTQKS